MTNDLVIFGMKVNISRILEVVLINFLKYFSSRYVHFKPEYVNHMLKPLKIKDHFRTTYVSWPPWTRQDAKSLPELACEHQPRGKYLEPTPGLIRALLWADVAATDATNGSSGLPLPPLLLHFLSSHRQFCSLSIAIGILSFQLSDH